MEKCRLFSFVVWTILYSIVCAIGIPGNLLSIIVFSKTKESKQNSANILLKWLLLNGLGLLVTIIIVDSIPYGCDYTKLCPQWWITWPYIRYFWIFVPVFHMNNLWIAILISVNRYWAICKPLEVRFVWTTFRTKIYIGLTLFLVLMFNLPRFFEYRFDYVNGTIKESRTHFGQSASYKKGYKVYSVTVFYVFGPIVTMLLFTAKIVFVLQQKRSKEMINRFTHMAESEKKRMAKPNNEVTIILLIVIATTVVCQFPIAIYHLMRNTVEGEKCFNAIYILNHVSKFLVNVNAACSFLIYTTLSRTFRGRLKDLLSCPIRSSRYS